MKFRNLIEGVETDSLGNQLTPEQSKYFANSKVRDRNGNLLVVHHGTYNSFDRFDAGDIGFHFGTEKAAIERKDYYDNVTDRDWKVGKYYLNITNFLDMYDIADWDGSNLASHIIESRLLDLSDDEVRYLQQIQMMGGLGMNRSHKPTVLLRKFLTDRGIDGIMYENAYEDSGSISYIAFNPEQIKFITNKTPTSSKNMNEDIWDSSRKTYQPKNDAKFRRLIKKPLNTLTAEDIKYIYTIDFCDYMRLCKWYDSISDALNDTNDRMEDIYFQECADFFQSLSFPLTVYRAIRNDEFVDGKFKISGKNNSRSWSADKNIYSDKSSKFHKATSIVACEVEQSDIDVMHTVSNFIYYSSSRRMGGYGEYEITMKKSFSPSEENNLRWVKNPIDNKNLIEDILIPETNAYVDFVDEFHSKFNSMSTEQIISFLKINQRNDLDTESPMFILPNGKFVSVQETLDTNGVDTVELTHQSICECFAWRVMGDLNYDEDTIAEIVDQDWRLERELGDFLTELTYKLGWARINCGTKAVDKRFYGVLPNEVTNKQWWSFEHWLEWGYDHNKSDVLVFVTDEAIAKKFKMNDFAPIFPEDIIKTIRRFYSSGRFYESVSDKKLTERLQRLASNAFITDSPYQVRDLLMNKPKLYRILYDKNIDRYMIGDGNEVIHWELIEAAYKHGYYYMMDDFIDEIGTLDNYVEFGQGGQFLGDEEIESYLIYMVFSPDEEEFMLGEDGYQFRYKLPFGYIYTRDCYLEDCDLYNVVKRNITINEEKKMRNLIEGVWALPDNQRKVDIIKRLFKKEITADDIDKVKDILYNVLGSDELFDSFDSEEDVDYRYNIAGYLRDFLDDYSDKIDKELVDQLEETIGSFDRIYKKRVKESYIHTNSSGNPCDLICGSALKVGDSVYDDKSGHKLDVIEVEEMNSWSKYITFNDTVTGKTEQRHVGNLALFELAGEGDEQVEVDDDIEIEWHPIDDYFD